MGSVDDFFESCRRFLFPLFHLKKIYFLCHFYLRRSLVFQLASNKRKDFWLSLEMTTLRFNNLRFNSGRFYTPVACPLTGHNEAVFFVFRQGTDHGK